jgi:hypothetical protein
MNLLLAAVLLTQDKTAEETFKKIEETILKATTVSIKFKLEAIVKKKGIEMAQTVEGTVHLKEGNRLEPI